MTDRFSRLAALIFDVDGTLAETEELHRQAFNNAFAAAGLDWHWDAPLYARLLAVTGGKERISYFIDAFGGRPSLDAAAITRLHADKTSRYTSMISGGDVSLRPGVCRLLDEATACGLRLAIATTTSPENVTALLRATLGASGPDRFAVIGAGDCVAAKKPAPDIYRLVLDRLGLPAACCIAFEDTPNGLQAARGADLTTIVTLSLYGPAEGYDGAIAVIDHLGDPGRPCRVLRGPVLDPPWLGVDQLRAWCG